METNTEILIKLTFNNSVVRGKDKNAVIRGILDSAYTNKCFNGIFITAINDIVSMSEIYFNPFKPITFNVDVVAGVAASSINRGDIIPDAKLTVIDEYGYICKSKNAYINVININYDINLVLNSIIPIKVLEVTYPTYQDSISVIGEIWTPSPITPVKLVRRPASTGQTKIIADIRKILDICEKLISEINSSTSAMKKPFAQYIAPIVSKYTSNEKIDIVKLLTDEADTIVLSRSENILDLQLCVYDSTVNVQDVDYYPGLYSVVRDIMNILYMYSSMLSTYTSTEIVKDHTPLWRYNAASRAAAKP